VIAKKIQKIADKYFLRHPLYRTNAARGQ